MTRSSFRPAAVLATALVGLCALGLAKEPARETPSRVPPAVARAASAIRPETIRAHMRFLADDLLEGRGPGTRGHRVAALYVATELEALGLEPFGDGGTYFQEVRLARARAREAECRIGPAGGARPLAYGPDYVVFADPTGPDVAVEAPVAFVGYGVTAPEEHYDDYAGIDVAGQIAAYFPGAPPSFSEASRVRHDDPRSKREAAAARGAVGVLLLAADGEGATWDATVVASRFGTMALTEADDGPGEATDLAHLSPAGTAALFAEERGRLQEAVAAIEAGRAHSFHTSRRLVVRAPADRDLLSSENVVARWRGRDTKLWAEHVVYTAHLDHLGIGPAVNGDSIYNGARDNASGVAGLLAVARAFAALPARPRRSVVLVATTAEEPGLLGSTHFVTHSPMPLDGIVAAINLDGLAVFWPLRDAGGWGARHSDLGAIFEQAARAARLEATLPPDDDKVLLRFSDQASFARRGIPSVWLVYGDKSRDPRASPADLNGRWDRSHTPGDDMTLPFDFDSSARLARAAFLTGHLVADRVPRPRWRPGDPFGAPRDARAEKAAPR
jgi:hypothetical protein